MFFEGAEKKIEVIVAQGAPALRSLGRDFWEGIVDKATATILSSISNDVCDAYLLSESSLFVWDDHFLMLTCGNTTLVDAVLSFTEQYGLDNIAFCSYQRKNEYLSRLQKSAFNDDVVRLREIMPGKAFQLGHLDSHHHFLFHLDRPYQCSEEEKTSELLMYHIRGEIADYLSSENQSLEKVREIFGFDTVFNGFIFDDFLFTPYGYSMNAIRGREYATIHVTPQKNSSYVSFESNLDIEGDGQEVINYLLNTLNPGCWDIVGFNTESTHLPENAGCMSRCNLNLDSGSNISFRYYQATDHNVFEATEI
jgi:S-adenosylmethionine decarboxylase